MLHRVFTFILLLSAAVPGFAQDVELAPVTLPGSDFVPSIAQDREGAMWIATQDGLLRYDGEDARLFTHDSLDATSISHNYIEEVYVDRSGTLWVGTYGGGLNRYTPGTETFERLQHDPDDPRSLNHDNVAAILEDRNGVLWVGTRGGLNRFDRRTGDFERYEHDPDDPATISNNWARALHEDSRGRFWVGTHGGLNLFDRDEGTFTRFMHDPDDPESLIEGRVSAILEDDDGRLWIGTGRTTGGLNVLDVEDGTIARYRFDASASDWPADPRPSGPWTGGGVTAIEQDADGILWFANWEGWVTGFDPSTGRAVNYNVRELTDAPEAHPFTIVQSDDGALWFGSVYGPLLRSASP